MWILKTRELHKIPQSVIEMMIQTSLIGISDREKMTLTEAEISCNGGSFCNVFSGLQTHSQQLTFIRNNCDLLVSH